MTIIKRLLTMLLCITLVATISVTALAASIPFSSSEPCKAYCLDRSGHVSVYTDAALTRSNSNEYIDAATDECLLLSYDSEYNSVLARYPVADGKTKDRWVPAGVFFPKGLSDAKTVSVTKQLNGYKWSTGSESYGYADPGNTVYQIGTKDDRVRVMWPISGGWRCAFVNASDLENATKASESQKKDARKANGSKTSISYNDYIDMLTPFLFDSRFTVGTRYDADQMPYVSDWTCWGCCAFANDYATFVFGKETLWDGVEFYDPEEIRYGDVLEFENSPHYVVVLTREDDGSLLTIEGNWGGEVVCGTFYSIEDGVVCRDGEPFRTLEAGYHFT